MTPEISVQPTAEGTYRVEVREGDASTSHRVTVADSYGTALGLPHVDEEVLVEESFRFLLEREPKESILQVFELGVIERYFPEYPKEIARRLG